MKASRALIRRAVIQYMLLLEQYESCTVHGSVSMSSRLGSASGLNFAARAKSVPNAARGAKYECVLREVVVDLVGDLPGYKARRVILGYLIEEANHTLRVLLCQRVAKLAFCEIDAFYCDDEGRSRKEKDQKLTLRAGASISAKMNKNGIATK